MDGLEFVRQITRAEPGPGVPVVMITTESSEEHVQAGHPGRRPGIHPQAVHRRTGEGAGFAAVERGVNAGGRGMLLNGVRRPPS